MEQGKEAIRKTVSFHYKFTFPDKSVREFSLQLDEETLRLIPKETTSYPEWTQLAYRKCPNCPLTDDQHPRCPIAANLVDVVEYFKDSISHQEAEIEITTASRRYLKRTALQNGISSLIGIYMVTSGCPIMDKLRPMVKSHLPFATAEETLYRILSMYLLAQYFVYKNGQKPDWDLQQLCEIYEEVQIVNRSFCQRLSDIHVKDASLNAVVSLDSFAALTTFSLELDQLDRIKQLFHAYLGSDS